MPASEVDQLESSAQFLQLLRAVRLLSDAQFAKAILSLPPHLETAREVAQVLLDHEFLTPFQARRLLLGKRDGYVLGPYVFLDQLSSGRSGRVFKALHRTMNRVVAVKVLAPDITENEARLNHFYHQARAVAQVVHPHIVTVLDVNQIGRRLYLVLEYVAGAGADVLVKESGPLAGPQAFEFVRQAALGLQHAHDQGLIHGHIVPGCLLLGRPGGATASPARSERLQAKLGNFGLRGTPDWQSTHDSAWEPLDYQSPEVLQNLPDSPASDVYSLGCVLIFMLTGKPPFPCESVQDRLEAHLSSPPPNLTMLRPDVPLAVAHLIAAMLAKNPAHRPTAEQVAQQLHPYADSDDPTAQIDFNLPRTASGPASFTAGFFSGLTAPNSGVYTVPAPAPTATVDESSPWQSLTAATQDGVDLRTPVNLRVHPTKPARLTSSLTSLSLALAITICLATFLGVVFLLKRIFG